MKDEYIKSFYNEVSQVLEGDYKIILEPGRQLTEDWIEYDQVKWELEETLEKLVKILLKDKTLDLEEKILSVYEHICLNYVYDGNVLYFFRRDASDLNNIKYIAVDWYGRIVDEKWTKNRQKHNRRICYEFARFYAKAINELIGNNDDLEAFMLGDKENLHYVVGLTGKEYSLILDLDDFNKLKDLTRLKLGLTLEGIKILRDNEGKFQKAIDRFNENRLNNLIEVEEAKEKFKDKDIIKYFDSIVDILKSYDIDPQGFFEYMRKTIEDEDIEIEKIWRKIEGDGEKRHARCLIFNFDSKTYLLDSVDRILKVIIKEELDRKIYIFNPEENEYPYYGG